MGMLGVEGFAENRQRSLVLYFGFWQALLGLIESRQVVARHGNVRMIVPQVLHFDSERPLVELLRGGVVPLAVTNSGPVGQADGDFHVLPPPLPFTDPQRPLAARLGSRRPLLPLPPRGPCRPAR